MFSSLDEEAFVSQTRQRLAGLWVAGFESLPAAAPLRLSAVFRQTARIYGNREV
jgi:hypothetical protein